MRSSSASGRLAVDPLDATTQTPQLFFDVLVTAIDVVDAIDYGLAIGNEACQHQAGGGTQVSRHYLGTAQVQGIPADGGVALQLDVGSHASYNFV